MTRGDARGINTGGKRLDWHAVGCLDSSFQSPRRLQIRSREKGKVFIKPHLEKSETKGI